MSFLISTTLIVCYWKFIILHNLFNILFYIYYSLFYFLRHLDISEFSSWFTFKVLTFSVCQVSSPNFRLTYKFSFPNSLNFYVVLNKLISCLSSSIFVLTRSYWTLRFSSVRRIDVNLRIFFPLYYQVFLYRSICYRLFKDLN